ncbi:transmembrane protein-like [Tropilaelaps mercedesae]|uniref:Transmembrane protein-like n=1 Tax=Tropilaelaps mercedesae TaxID=418985 RepID=A0A1V9XDM1_9ACAR|nr:transmembrane protein-like [Tropilaelaps mercedesae]
MLASYILKEPPTTPRLGSNSDLLEDSSQLGFKIHCGQSCRLHHNGHTRQALVDTPSLLTASLRGVNTASLISNGVKVGWDEAVTRAAETYRGRPHNLFCDNCHSHVATALNQCAYDETYFPLNALEKFEEESSFSGRSDKQR